MCESLSFVPFLRNYAPPFVLDAKLPTFSVDINRQVSEILPTLISLLRAVPAEEITVLRAKEKRPWRLRQQGPISLTGRAFSAKLFTIKATLCPFEIRSKRAFGARRNWKRGFPAQSVRGKLKWTNAISPLLVMNIRGAPIRFQAVVAYYCFLSPVMTTGGCESDRGVRGYCWEKGGGLDVTWNTH